METDLQNKFMEGLKQRVSKIEKDFVEHYYPLARKYAKQIDRASHDIDQNTSEILTKSFYDAQRKAGKRLDAKFNLDIFMNQTMVNRKIDIIRRNTAKKNQFDYNLHESQFKTSQFSKRYHEAMALDTYLNKYAECECKRLLQFRREGVIQKEVAEILDLSESSVKAKTLKCLEQARTWFKKNEL